jgi:hypothetical protein
MIYLFIENTILQRTKHRTALRSRELENRLGFACKHTEDATQAIKFKLKKDIHV